jgi:hypothetical protein
LSALSWEGGCLWEGGCALHFPWRSGAERKALCVPDPDVLFVLFGCSVCYVGTLGWSKAFFFFPWELSVRARPLLTCDCMRTLAVQRLCDWVPQRLPFQAGFLFAEPICIVSCCFSARVGLVFIAWSKMKFRAFVERSHTYACTSTAYILKRFPSVMVSYIPRNTDQYRPKNTNSGCNSSYGGVVDP